MFCTGYPPGVSPRTVLRCLLCASEAGPPCWLTSGWMGPTVSMRRHWEVGGEVGLFLPCSLAALALSSGMAVSFNLTTALARLPLLPSSGLSGLCYRMCLSHQSWMWKCLSVVAHLWVPPWPLLALLTAHISGVP